MTMKLLKYMIGALGFLGLFLGLTAPAAYAHGGDAAKIHACVNNHSGEIKIVDANAVCKHHETPLDWDVASRTEPGTFAIDCNAGQTITEALKDLISRDTLLVSGMCNENVSVGEGKNNITLDGQGTATINGPDPASETITIRGRRITVRGFTITGGRHGVRVRGGGPATIANNTIQATGGQGIAVTEGGDATIDSNTIQNNPNDAGIVLVHHSSADILNNTIQNNGRHGIFLYGNASADIGIRGTQSTTNSPNLIQNNGDSGIAVTRSSQALIVANIIRNNARHGIDVSQVSNADVASNAIDGNSGDGIRVHSNAGVHLGSDTGTRIIDLPNDTTSNNALFGIRCFVGGYAEGRLGTLNGNSGPSSFDTGTGTFGGCINSLIP